MGTLWTRPKTEGNIITIYLHPDRYTCQFFQDNEYFTVSFFSPEYRKALEYCGTHSGRTEDKILRAGLTPTICGESIPFQEVAETYLCRKIYQHPFSKEGMAEDIKEYYQNNPQSFPHDADGNWQPHWMFIGEIIDKTINKVK